MDPQQAKIYTAVIIACVVLGGVIIAFVYSFVRQQRRYIRITRSNILAELSLLEKDRMRIAADLHDELSPLLTAVKFQLVSIDPADPADQKIIDTAASHIDESIGRLRGISKDLMPAALTRKGLVPALSDYFNLINDAHGLHITFHHDEDVDIPESKRINIYRIIQEITHNTVKHARATRFLVYLKQKGDLLTVLCEDNGCGFDYQKMLSEQNGLGLRNITGRAALVSNNFNVTSQPGKGTQYTFDIPLTDTYERTDQDHFSRRSPDASGRI